MDSTNCISPAGKPITRPVTIGDAQTWYGQADGVVQHSALRELITLMIQQGVRTEFENDSYLDALVLSEVMFARSNRTIRMLAGRSCERFLQTLQRSFVSALDRLQANGGRVQILMIADSVPDFLVELGARYRGTLEFGLGKLKEGATQIGHFLVCDSRMARIEQPHEALTDQTPVDAVHAKVYFSDAARAQLLEAKFEAFWKIVRPANQGIAAAGVANVA